MTSDQFEELKKRVLSIIHTNEVEILRLESKGEIDHSLSISLRFNINYLIITASDKSIPICGGLRR
jgi:hypothetical protein